MNKQMDKIANQTVTSEELAEARKTVEANRLSRTGDGTGSNSLRFDEGEVCDSRLINGGIVYGD
jgi:hypothetical protein